MLQHYITIAIRNILKYKLQSIISLLGLAISFACVSLAVYWNHYEMSFDSFHQHADRIYRIRKNENGSHVNQQTYGDILSPLKRNYPEIEKICALRPVLSDITDIDGNIVFPEHSISFSHSTPDIFDIFDFEWIEGNAKVVSNGENNVAVSEFVAKKISKHASSIGYKLLINGKAYEITGVYKAWGEHSNLDLDIINILPETDENFTKGSLTYAMFRSEVNPELFIQKIKHDTITHWLGQFPQILNLWTPLKALHYTYPENERNVRVSDVYLFTGFAILLSLCALLNYLTLFISRIRLRGRNMALRMICGSSNIQLGLLLMTEYILLLFISLLVSMALIELSIPVFIELSQIVIERSSIYLGCGYLLLFIVFLSLLLSCVPVFYFHRKELRMQLNSSPVRSGNNSIRLTSVCLQLVTGIFFMFCTMMMMKQIHHLLHTDIHIERKRIAVIQSLAGESKIMNVLQQIPSIKEMTPIANSLFPMRLSVRQEAVFWDGKAADANVIPYQYMLITESAVRFYDLKIKAGSQISDLKNHKEVLINETFARKMGVINPIGKVIDNTWIVRGIISDFQSQTPTSPIPPILFRHLDSPLGLKEVAFKYEGEFSEVEQTIQKAFERENITYSLEDSEAEYRKLLEPEYNILKLMSVVFVVSLAMAMFGIYSLVVQDCEKRRKEIAIRKVSGAHVIDILSLFFIQYMRQVIIAAIIAFPIGYCIIKHWLEQYTLQTEISFWVFFAVFFSTTLLVVLCVGWNVWQTANENPAHVIKKE